MNHKPLRSNRPGCLRRIILTACLLSIGFSIGIIMTLKAVGFS